MRKLIPIDVIDGIIDEIRASNKSEVLKNLGNDSSDRSLTLQDLADAVDRALVEVGEALKDALDAEHQGQEEQSSWWDLPEDGPYDLFWQGGLTEEGLLPRRDSSASRWNG